MRGTVLAFLIGAALLPAQNLTGVKAITATGNSSYALLSDGTVWWWGDDGVGLWGSPRTRPARWGNLSHVVAVSPPLALRVDGTVWACWPNPYGPDRPDNGPVRVNGLDGAVAVAGVWPSLALKSDGTVWEWYGTLAFGVPSTPVRVSGLTEVAAIAMGFSHSLALKRDGTVWTWGDNQDGSLGDGLTASASTLNWPALSTPVQVPGLGDVVAVAAGYGHNLALKSDGTVWAWGFNGHGQLGDGTTETRTTPIQVSGLAGVVKIAAGDAHSVAVKSDGTVWTWGSNVGGQLGDGTTTDQLKPVQVSGLSRIAAIAAGRYHTLALNEDGTLCAWGVDQFGQLGDGVQLEPFWWETAAPPPVEVGGLAGVTKIAAGGTHSLALKSDGTLWAWGDNSAGQLGDGQTRGLDWPDRSTPVKVSGLPAVAVIAGGTDETLAVTTDGAVWAWGRYAGVQDGKPSLSAAPVQVSGLSGVMSVTAGVGHSLAVKGDGTVWEWATNYYLGPPFPPVQVSGLTEVVAVAGGSMLYNLAVKRDGTVWGWGSNFGPAPVQVSGLSDVLAVAAHFHSFTLKRDGTVWAWGDNFWGQLGDGTRTARNTPVQVTGLSDVVAIDTRADDMFIGPPHSVALKQDGTVWEWSIWDWESVSPKSLTPVQVAGLSDIVAVAEGGGHSLALKRDGTVWAWGQNIYGQLGVRTFVIRTTPVQVVAPAP